MDPGAGDGCTEARISSPAPTDGPPVLLSGLVQRAPRLLVRTFAAAHTTLFLRTRGLAGGRWFGVPILVLETVGRRSGRRRTNPVVYLRDGNNFVIVPANGGDHRSPEWWLNLRAAGEGVAVVGHERRRVTPHEATGAERERLWRHFAAVTPVDHYQRRTPRRIPVVVLAPAPSGPPEAASLLAGAAAG